MTTLVATLRIGLIGFVLLIRGAHCQEKEDVFCIQAVVEKDVVPVSEPVRLSIVIRNTGKEAETIHVASPHVFLEISLIGLSGERIPRTAYGKRRIDLDAEGANSRLKLDAGESYRTEVPEFSRCFDISKIGKYRLTVLWRRPGIAGELTSKETVFGVAAEDDARLKKSK